MKKKTVKPEVSADGDIVKYIESLKFGKKLLGMDEKDLWTVVSNIQKYYEQKANEDEAIINELKKTLADKEAQIAKKDMYIAAYRRKYESNS